MRPIRPILPHPRKLPYIHSIASSPFPAHASLFSLSQERKEIIDISSLATYNRARNRRGGGRIVRTGAWTEGVEKLMVMVEIREGESLDSAIRRLKRQVQQAGVLEEARRHERYEKPSERRRRLAATSARRVRKNLTTGE